MHARTQVPASARRRTWGGAAAALSLVAMFGVVSCSGAISGGGSGGGSTNPTGMTGNPPTGMTVPPTGNGGVPAMPAPTGVMASESPMRRLNADQYHNTVQDLLGLGELATPATLPPDESISNERFISNTERPVQGSDADRYADVAQAIATKAVMNLPALLGCDATGANEATCVGSFIEKFGKRVYRRPLTATEIGRARTLFTAGRANGGDLANGVRLVLQGMLQSGSFLYLVEPAPANAAGKVVVVDPFAMASRLSYFLLNSTPDNTLLDAAEANQLTTPEQVASQAQRLMGTPRFRDMVANFHTQWLELSDLTSADKDATLFPAWSEPLRAAMLEEPRQFVQWVMTQGDGKADTLLSAPFSVLSGPLYDLYGVTRPAGVAADAWTKVDLDPKQRAGLLTQAGLMASLAKEDRTSFIRRGKLVREGMLCTPLADPPPGVDASESAIPPTADARERARLHRDKPECAACHALFDPLGFAFENYDAIGRYRTIDNGKPVDASTEITGTSTLDGKVTNAIDMAGKLAASEEAKTCVARMWMRYALGREETADDNGSLTQAVNGFKSGGWKVTELLAALARSDSFRYQKVKP
jgi:hypothetical protein